MLITKGPESSRGGNEVGNPPVPASARGSRVRVPVVRTFSLDAEFRKHIQDGYVLLTSDALGHKGFSQSEIAIGSSDRAGATILFDFFPEACGKLQTEFGRFQSIAPHLS